jgi:hypothetical protein
MKAVCVNCQTELRPKQNGVYVIEMASFGPSKFWHADLWACPGCGFEIVGGFASQPIAEHYQPQFDEHIARARKHGERVIYDYERAQVAAV